MKQIHHIVYNEDMPDGGWTVELNGIQHQTLTAIQRMKSTPENYAALTNFAHAVMFEWNKMRQELDIERK